MADTLESLAARVDFIEKWLAIPVVHLPGYVVPVLEPEAPAAEVEAEAEVETPVLVTEEPTNAEGNSQSEQLPVLDGQAQ